MRELTRESDNLAASHGYRIEMIDGIKLFMGEEGVLVLPDQAVSGIFRGCNQAKQ